MYVVFLQWFLPNIYRSLRFRKKFLSKFLVYSKTLSEEENLVFKLHKGLVLQNVAKCFDFLKRFVFRVSSFKNVCKQFVAKGLVVREFNNALYLVNLKKNILNK